MINSILILSLIDLDFMQSIGTLKDPLLHWPQYLLNDLPHLSFHLEPFELLDLKLLVLSHLINLTPVSYTHLTLPTILLV